MKKIAYFLICTLSIVFFSCNDHNYLTEAEGNDSDKIIGSWLLYESGYSPGSGYVVNEVPNDPPQVIILKDDNTMTSTISGVSDYKYYQLLKDSIGSTEFLVLAIFKLDPGSQPKRIEEVDHSYTISFKNGDMLLTYRYCIEGCHLAFRNLKE